ncbi:flagellar hook-associated protein FlgK [Ureibacillus sinduriensis]|uniref:Flagellar hook-associated protein 1 n=1 Tax=Ureibacillus sinduriensis BLB-1 = JCM 15800 TaxID=1384057 RepID=A0A0A3HVM8_9BACL|nr:flagellar hook-associated protein FlgK [Ureibacillus sinduriensis]KGR76504.1 flagellar hook protein FlgK [Ureibacillus sinduriensis BLB-1 = JCM 15800]
MRSTFMGLETSKRGLYTQQSALYTTGHNISNANTVGYSRQRVNMTPTLGYPGIGLNAPMTAGFIGTGVEAESVQRIRDQFIDRQYRQETNKLGYYESRSSAISQMEDVMSEPSEYGLNEAFNQFWSSLQDVSTNPEDAASRKVAVQRAEHLADTFNYLDTQLKQIQGNLGNEIDVSTTQINSILKQIAEINKQVQSVEPNGYMPNDLYDARDNLVDQLNQYIPVSVTSVKSGGNALEIAEGSYTITFNGVELVKGNEYAEITALDTGTPSKKVDGNVDDPTTGAFNSLSKISVSILGNPPVSGTEQGSFEQKDFEVSKGKLLSLINSYGYQNTGGSVEGYYPDMLANLDHLANVFATVFNQVHEAGYTIDQTTKTGVTFFDGGTPITAANIKVTDAIKNNSSLIAASSKEDEEGNGKWAAELAKLQSVALSNGGFNIKIDGNTIAFPGAPSLDGATYQSFYEGLVGKLGVDGQEAKRLQYNAETIRLTVQNNKASISSVSLDEEMTNMITFQQAYNANARMITVIDETLDKIINGLGRVGL